MDDADAKPKMPESSGEISADAVRADGFCAAKSKPRRWRCLVGDLCLFSDIVLAQRPRSRGGMSQQELSASTDAPPRRI